MLTKSYIATSDKFDFVTTIEPPFFRLRVVDRGSNEIIARKTMRTFEICNLKKILVRFGAKPEQAAATLRYLLAVK